MKPLFFVVTFLLCVLIAAYGVIMYGFGSGGWRLPPEMRQNFEAQALFLSAHVLFSSAALVLGPLQFITLMRLKWPAIHRVIGRVYLLVAVPIGGAAGFVLSFYAYGGLVAELGFGTLAVLWLYTAFQGFQTARRAEFEAHRRWLIRNFALTFAAVTLRLFLIGSTIAQWPFDPSYRFIAWMCWLPNLVVAESWIRAFPATISTKNRPDPKSVEAKSAETKSAE